MKIKITKNKGSQPKKETFIDELSQSRTYLDDQIKDIIIHVVSMCKKLIKIANNSGSKNYIYDVPTFIIGYPLYDVGTVLTGVNIELKKIGLKTMVISTTKIYINW